MLLACLRFGLVLGGFGVCLKGWLHSCLPLTRLFACRNAAKTNPVEATQFPHKKMAHHPAAALKASVSIGPEGVAADTSWAISCFSEGGAFNQPQRCSFLPMLACVFGCAKIGYPLIRKPGTSWNPASCPLLFHALASSGQRAVFQGLLSGLVGLTGYPFGFP